MGLGSTYPSDDVIALRYGNYYDWDPNAHAPLPFVYMVAQENAPEETWGQEAVFFHNPNATHPIVKGLFSAVSEASIDGSGVYSVKSNKEFFPFMSMTSFFTGDRRIEEAISMGNFWWEVLQMAYQASSQREGNPMWS